MRRRLFPDDNSRIDSGLQQPSPLLREGRWHFPVQEPASGNRYSLLRITTRSGLTGW